MLVNALRAHLAEFGIVAAQGLRNVGELIAIVRDDGDTRLPDMARQVLQVLANRSSRSKRRLQRWSGSCWPGTRPTRSVSGWPAFRALGLSSLLQLPRRLRTRRFSARAASSPPGWAWCRGRIQPAGKPGWAASPSAATVICAGCSSTGQAPDSIRASSPSGLREQAGHMTASDFCAGRYIFSCQAGAIHT
jgi:hypothetical protein